MNIKNILSLLIFLNCIITGFSAFSSNTGTGPQDPAVLKKRQEIKDELNNKFSPSSRAEDMYNYLEKTLSEKQELLKSYTDSNTPSQWAKEIQDLHYDVQCRKAYLDYIRKVLSWLNRMRVVYRVGLWLFE